MAMTIVGLVHALVIGPLLMGRGATPLRRFGDTAVGASVADSDQVPLLTVVFLQNAVSTARSASPVWDLPSRGRARADQPVRVLSPDVRPAHDSGTIQAASAAPPADRDETGEHARLLGRYLGQIQARVMRAWIRPRTPIDEGRFRCLPKILQDRQGHVLEVELQACNGDALWQTSLVMAIETASPLPAPPDPSVFTQVLDLSFEARPFSPAENPQDYEPEQTPRLAASALRVGTPLPTIVPLVERSEAGVSATPAKPPDPPP